jgi:glycosyltransferase involved in cell wall biosynthesis
MNEIFVSVITVVRNDAAGVEKTILSVREQSYKNIDYVVIDGGSTDGTVDIIKKHEGSIATWKSEPDRGIAEAFNKGVALSRGDLLLFMNSSDSFCSKTSLAEAIAALPRDCDPRRTIFYGNARIVSEKGSRLQECDHRALVHHCSICHQSALIGRIVQSAHLYDERLATQMDYDLWLRCLDSTPFVKIDTVISDYKEGGITGADKHGIRFRIERTAVRWLNGREDMSIRSTFDLLLELLAFVVKRAIRGRIGQRRFRRIKRLLMRKPSP